MKKIVYAMLFAALLSCVAVQAADQRKFVDRAAKEGRPYTFHYITKVLGFNKAITSLRFCAFEHFNQ